MNYAFLFDNWAFAIGLTLLVTNQVVGWGGVALCMYMARKTGKKHFYAAGTGIYALSWGMMILGAAMVGPHGISHARAILSRDVVLSLLLLLLLGIAYYVWKERRP